MKRKVIIMLFVAMLAVSTAPIIAKWLNGVPAVVISFWRMALASTLIWGYSSIHPQERLSKSNRIKTTIAGMLLGLHFIFFFGAIKLTTVSDATFLGTLAPMFTIIIEKYVLGRSISKTLVYGLITALLGAMIIIGKGFDLNNYNTLGNLMAFSSSIFLGGAFIIAGDVRESEGTVAYSRNLYLAAAITILIVVIARGESLIGYSNFEYLGLFMLAAIPTLLGHNALYYAVKFVPPTLVATFPLGEPVIASIFAWILFQEIIGLNIIVGGLLTLCGLYIITRNPIMD